MTYTIKPFILTSCVAGLSMVLSACASSGNNIDYSNDVETPDVLLQDVSGGDSEYGLDKNAARNNQQNKPDGLIQSTKSRSPAVATSTATSNQQPNQKATKPKYESQATVERQATQTPPVKQSKPNKPQKPKEQPSEQRSALEVDDPLLGEIDPT